MTIVFMALFSAIIEDRVSSRAGKALLWPLIVAGAASVGYWHLSELHGNGDLRPYGLVQFLPMVPIPLILILIPVRDVVHRLPMVDIGYLRIFKNYGIL